MVWGGRKEEGSGWGTRVCLWRIHFDIWQNQYNIVKFKNKIKLKKISIWVKIFSTKNVKIKLGAFTCFSGKVQSLNNYSILISKKNNWCNNNNNSYLISTITVRGIGTAYQKMWIFCSRTNKINNKIKRHGQIEIYAMFIDENIWNYKDANVSTITYKINTNTINTYIGFSTFWYSPNHKFM